MVTMATSSSPEVPEGMGRGQFVLADPEDGARCEIELVEHLAARRNGFSLPSSHDDRDVRAAVRVAVTRATCRHHVLPHTDAVVFQ
jgi:hypothetical protein